MLNQISTDQAFRGFCKNNIQINASIVSSSECRTPFVQWADDMQAPNPRPTCFLQESPAQVLRVKANTEYGSLVIFAIHNFGLSKIDLKKIKFAFQEEIEILLRKQ